MLSDKDIIFTTFADIALSSFFYWVSAVKRVHLSPLQCTTVRTFFRKRFFGHTTILLFLTCVRFQRHVCLPVWHIYYPAFLLWPFQSRHGQ